MTEPDAESWADALLMYRQYSIIAVTQREEEEWWYDVASIIRGNAQDPRGWQSLDHDEGQDERQDDPNFPFMTPPTKPEDVRVWQSRVKEIPRASVERFLVVLATSYLDVKRELEFERKRVEMERRARVILSRFPLGTRFYANTGYGSEEPDFYLSPPTGGNPCSQWDWDAGLIAVSDDEVGLFWSFDAR
ncbi:MULTISPECIES: hypothetical protein [unclassified Streptomyces]|uniref:hypothetical protein n=1 Tax=Streptomyces sp. NPDC127532 TaxID=3345399 RepID=UPI00362CFAFB